MEQSPQQPDQSDVVDHIPDDAFVVRGGLIVIEDIAGKVRTHPSGIVGLSVRSAVGVSIPDLSVGLRNSQIGVTTVGKVRAAGGDVIRTSGGSPYHATMTGLTPEQVHRLMTPTLPNPALRPRGRR